MHGWKYESSATGAQCTCMTAAMAVWRSTATTDLICTHGMNMIIVSTMFRAKSVQNSNGAELDLSLRHELFDWRLLVVQGMRTYSGMRVCMGLSVCR